MSRLTIALYLGTMLLMALAALPAAAEEETVIEISSPVVREDAAAPVAPAASIPAPAPAAIPTEVAEECESCRRGETLTGHWFGAGHALLDCGLDLRLSATQVIQDVAHGGLSTHRRKGRYAGSYDLEIEADMEKVAGLAGGTLYIHGEGSWSHGVDPTSVGSLFGTNADAAGNRSIDVTEVWYEQALADGKVRVRLGKLDLTGTFECHGCPVAFDGNRFANDETLQFLNGALVNNPTIPFPDRGLGAILYVQPTDQWYLAAGLGDARADARETGFNTAFESGSRFISLYETGYVVELPSANGPIHGAYRVGLWHDPQVKDRFDEDGTESNDTGWYISADQVILKENSDPEDTQGLGVFTRLGWADEAVNDVRFFWSAGAQYQGLLEGRDDDVLGVGMARGRTSREPNAEFTAAHETVLEAYYNIQVTPWLSVSPDLQYIWHPGGQSVVKDAFVVGVRIQASF